MALARARSSTTRYLSVLRAPWEGPSSAHLVACRTFRTPTRSLSQESKPSSEAPPPRGVSPSIAHCMQVTKKADYMHYYCTLFMPQQARNATFAIRAFNIETASIKNFTSNSDVAAIKLQWWKDTVDECMKGASPNHPVAIALAESMQNVKLSKTWFNKIIDSRQKDLITTQPRSLEALEQYAESTASSLLYLALESMGIRDINADHAASHIGKALGLMTIIKALPYNARVRQLNLPMDVTVRHGLVTEDVFKGEFTQPLHEAVYEVANLAKTHLDMGREMKSQLKYPAQVALLPAEFADDFLDKLQRHNFNPFVPELQQNPLMPRLKKSAFRQTNDEVTPLNFSAFDDSIASLYQLQDHCKSTPSLLHAHLQLEANVYLAKAPVQPNDAVNAVFDKL